MSLYLLSPLLSRPSIFSLPICFLPLTLLTTLLAQNGDLVNTGKMFLKSSRFHSSIEVNDNKNTIELNKHNDWYYYLDTYSIYITTNKPKLQSRIHLSEVEIKHQRGSRFYEPRDYDMLNGFHEIVSYYKLYNNDTFPDIFGLYTTRDHAHDKSHVVNSSCVVRDESNKYIASYSLPPIFSQNRLFNSTSYVLMPDFTYFSTFHNYHNHGNPKSDIWFHQLKKAQNKSTIRFKKKKLSAVWRGTFSHAPKVARSYDSSQRVYIRSWNDYRVAAVGCHNRNGINTNGSFILKRDMCNRNKALISIPGFGVWTWGLKFQLLCDSINILMPPSVTGGETWETRESLGLIPNIHYLSLSGNISTVCKEMNDHISFIRNNEETVMEMIKNKRNIIFHRLSKESVLTDFLNLILKYSKAYQPYEWSKYPFTWNLFQ